MITVRDVHTPGDVDLIEEGLMQPVPALEANTIMLEERDGSDIRRIAAKGAWVELNDKRTARVSDVRIDVFITDARLALACTKYTKGGGWIGFGGGGVITALALNAGSKALAARRRHGKMLVGQVRYPWLRSVGSSGKTGWGSEERIYLNTKASDTEVCLAVTLPKNVDSASVAAEVARRAARWRLAHEREFTDEQRSRLEELTTAEPLEPPKGKIRFHVFPNYWKVHEKSARFGLDGDPASVTQADAHGTIEQASAAGNLATDAPAAPAGAGAATAPQPVDVAPTPGAAGAPPEAASIEPPTPPSSPSVRPADHGETTGHMVAGDLPEMRFCTACGVELRRGAAFCSKCGEPVVAP